MMAAKVISNTDALQNYYRMLSLFKNIKLGIKMFPKK